MLGMMAGFRPTPTVCRSSVFGPPIIPPTTGDDTGPLTAVVEVALAPGLLEQQLVQEHVLMLEVGHLGTE